MKGKIVYLLVFLSLNAFSQENLWYDRNFDSYQNYFENEYGIICKEPDKFINSDIYFLICKIADNPRKSTAFFCGPVFQNKNVMIMYPALLDGDFVPRSVISRELSGALELYYGPHSPLNNKIDKVRLEQYLTIISGRKASEMFNVDSIYIYEIPHADSVSAKLENRALLPNDKHRHCIGIAMCKDGFYSFFLKLFFTDKSYKRKEEYIEMLNGKIWYDDNFENTTQ